MPGGRVACREIRLARRCELAQTTRPEDASLARIRMSYSSRRSFGFHNSRTNCLFTLKLVIWACPVAMSVEAEGTDLPVRGSENFGQKETTIPLDSRRSEPPERPFVFLHRGLLVIVRPMSGNPTKSPRLLPPYTSYGRLSVDLNAAPAVDLRRGSRPIFQAPLPETGNAAIGPTLQDL